MRTAIAKRSISSAGFRWPLSATEVARETGAQAASSRRRSARSARSPSSTSRPRTTSRRPLPSPPTRWPAGCDSTRVGRCERSASTAGRASRSRRWCFAARRPTCAPAPCTCWRSSRPSTARRPPARSGRPWRASTRSPPSPTTPSTTRPSPPAAPATSRRSARCCATSSITSSAAICGTTRCSGSSGRTGAREDRATD